ncbi:Hypothetical predicted protein [Paramuricea clavata]|uniref:Uncharacterized protein n=1 Tax=Paramuricea clavata TaxID=317549 RepID=A0A7D9EA24_PARCT|nr:Hypothetical predicted protein [Paramuricea clavata]
MAHIINTARTKQRSIVITLLNLKNAFGEVRHDLIYEVLDYHHVPNHMKNLICSLYTHFQTSIITEQFNTPIITVGRGVLQGDCLSPLLFNMSFSTFIQQIKSEKYRQLGFWKLSEIGIPIKNHSTSTFNSLWSSVQSKLPKNIFNFTIRYISNTLPTRKNLSLWELSSTSDCSFCSSPETLLHMIAGCKTYLDEGRFTWRHDSVLNFLASTLTAVKNSTLYADIPGFMNPSVITGDRLRPDLLLVTENRCLYILELTVGYESNLQINANRKRQKYRDLINEEEADYDKVKFVNLSLSTLGVFGRSSENFNGMLSSLKCDAKYSKYIKRKS